MSANQYKSSSIRARLGNGWRAFQEGYRTINAMSRNVIGWILKLALLAYFIFCAVFLTLRYVVLPNIDQYKGQVEEMATSAIGLKVSIARIQASWQGLRPHLSFGDVAVYDKQGDRALSLPDVSATLSWATVFSGSLRLHMLEIQRPDLDIERDADGNLFVAGLLIDRKKSTDGKGADWILAQREIVIRDGRLRWTDRQRNAPVLLLDKVDFVLHNQWRHHRFALKATPPAEMGAPIELRADFEHPRFAKKISDATQWTGTLYADWPNSDVAVWKSYIDYPIEIRQGKGSIQAWLSFDRARVADFTADLTLSDVSARLRKDLQLLNLSRVSGRVSAREVFGSAAQEGLPSFGANGHTVSLTNFSVETNDGLKLPATTISETFVAATPQQPAKTAIKASAIDLRTFADFVEHLPLSVMQRKLLTDFAPRGQLKDFSAEWHGAYPDISAYRFNGQFIGLSMTAQLPHPAQPASGSKPAQAAVPGIPGFDNLTGSIDASERGGSFRLASNNLVLRVPGYFADPSLPFDSLDMQGKWVLQDQNSKLLLQIDSMKFVQDGLAGSLSSKHLMPLQKPQQDKAFGTINLTARIEAFDFKKINRYLPVHTPDDLRNWLGGALEGGSARDVTVRINGDLADFPFRTGKPGEKPKGEFSIAGKIDGGKLNYSPGRFGKDQKSPLWPLLEQIKGTFAMDRGRLEIKAETAKTHGAALSNVVAVIPDLLSSDRMLEIDGSATASLQDFVRYVNDSPVNGWIAHFTDETKAAGNAKLALKLQLPLARMLDSKVQGSLQFTNNDVTLQNAIPPLLQANGELKFHEKGFSLHGIRANFLGGQATATGGTQRDGATAVKVDGGVTLDGLRKNYGAPAMQRLFQHTSGGTRYSASINIRNRRPEVLIESTLQGVALNFPVPLRKSASESMPVKFELTGLVTDDVVTARDEIKLTLGSAVAARYFREKKIDGGDWRVARGGIGINVPAPEPDSGLIANVNLKSLNMDAWRNVVTSIVTVAKPHEGTARVAASNAADIAQYIEPDVLAARATELIVMGKKLDNVVVGASHQKGVWQANIDAEQVSGYVTWTESRTGSGLGRVSARLASLIIPKSAASDVSELLEAKNSTTQIPTLDIVAENFELFGRKLGHLELDANNVSAAAGTREWQIRKLTIVNPDAELKGSGKWTIHGGESISNLTYALDISDAGKLLDRFGFPNLVRGGKGRMDGDVSWKGLPFSIDIPTLSGQLHLDIMSGQFLKVDAASAGAAKLLGVISLQSLPRRLSLDFRDVFSEGYAFDVVVGTAVISQGMVRTDNFKMRSVSAVVLMDGTADIARESQNLHVVVIPEVNAGAASVVYALAVNPLVGLGSFLAQLFLRDPLMRAFTVEYQINGSWKDPAVTKLARKNAPNASAPGDNVPSAVN